MQKFTPKQYLAIDIANSYGLDKLTWDERLAWFEQHKHDLFSKLPEAEEPAMFYAGVKAWEATQRGEATGYPVSLDATSSGLQILSVLVGDERAARLSNVIPNDAQKRSNAYQELYQAMAKREGGQLGLSYADVKQAIMTAFYGSTAVPERVFGEERIQVFFETLEQECPHVWELNKAFVKFWDPTALCYEWVMPDNFHVRIKVKDHVKEDVTFMGQAITVHRVENMPTRTGRSLGANITHSVDGFIVRELLRRCSVPQSDRDRIQALINYSLDPRPIDRNSKNVRMVEQLWKLYEKSGYLSARILDYLDKDSIFVVNTDPIQDLLDSLPRKPFKIIPVHDCFRVHPNYGNDLRQQYNWQLALIAESNLLSFLLSQALRQNIRINKQADLAYEILQANYALS